ncbi:putative PEP-binding protein [Cryptosporangium aurantiacum]|uniref:PEP-utilising enzyme, TIM barrel domain n=1 Tax=Cryptosporangium aurantiacum TaxID=134849 RepID=A0A1M7RKP6_9ACTN|nr:putative PEP-binding protein [Cryptosporangium aurantiacum]SHN46877.1 PEP-utilising enzyme, TIM barrel domain [Cryptosporangium aurantiacum]
MNAPLRGRLADGQPVSLLAELVDPSEAESAAAAGAEGVGLLRSWFAVRPDGAPLPVAEQQAGYRRVLRAFPGARVAVEALDPGERQGAFGIRGVRALQARPDVLSIQLDAVSGAARETGAEQVDVGIVTAMVTEPEEVAWFLEEARFGGVATAGVLVDLPAAAVLAGTILRAASFATIDTDGLTRYAVAADRAAGTGRWYDPWQPATLRLAELVGASGSLAGKEISARGAGAADPLLACVLIGLGVTSLVLPPDRFEPVRAELARHAFSDCLRYAELATRAASAEDARRRVHAAIDR